MKKEKEEINRQLEEALEYMRSSNKGCCFINEKSAAEFFNAIRDIKEAQVRLEDYDKKVRAYNSGFTAAAALGPLLIFIFLLVLLAIK